MIQLAEMVLLLFVGEVIQIATLTILHNLPCEMMCFVPFIPSQLAAHDKAILSLASNVK